MVDVATGIALTTVFFTGMESDFFPRGIAITPGGDTVYVTGIDDFNNGFLIPISTLTNQAGTPLFLNAFGPGEVAITPDGQTVYVTTSSPSVIPIDVATQTALPPISFENGADSIVITPDQAPVANFEVEVGGVGSSTNFDASGSYSPVATVTTYAWDFGDGDSDVSEFPAISHIYSQPGTYEVLLTVTNSAGTSTMQTFTGKTVSNNGGENAQTSQSITIGNLASPTNLTGKRIARCYNSLNIITWSAPSGTPPAAYRVYRNSLDSLVATIAGDRAHKYVDRHIWQSVAYTYYVVSVDEEGNEYAPASITIYPSFVACQQ